MHDRKTVIVLGGTNPHKELIERLKKKGYYTVLVDYLDNPPAKAAADEHVQESTLDKELVVKIAKDKNAVLVISTCVDHANVIAAYASEKLGLPRPYSYDSARKIADKTMMKEIMVENGIPTARHESFDERTEIPSMSFRFPVVVKPADTGGSKGVRVAENPEELEAFSKDALDISQSKKGIVEEYLEGMEFQAYFFIHNRRPHLGVIMEKHRIFSDNRLMMQAFMASIPAEISKDAKKKIQEIAEKLTEIFKLNNTALFIQGILNQDEVQVIEFAPRIGGGLSYRLIEMATGMKILDHSIDGLLSSEISIQAQSPQEHFAICNLYSTEGIYSHIEGFEELIKDGLIEEYYHYRSPGDQISQELVSRNRVAAFITKGKNKETLIHHVIQSVERIRIYLEDGRESHRREIYTYLKEGIK